jgi:putative endonuclease
MKYFIYILQSEKDGTYYIGHTSNLEARIRRHNQGGSAYTKSKAPWKLLYEEDLNSKAEAMNREREIKGKKSREYIEQLVRASRGVSREG